jgi:hypothetical protein
MLIILLKNKGINVETVIMVTINRFDDIDE